MVAKSIDFLSQDRRKTKELVAIRERADGLLKQIERITRSVKTVAPGSKNLTKRMSSVAWALRGTFTVCAGV